jgi:hypothetical protein
MNCSTTKYCEPTSKINEVNITLKKLINNERDIEKEQIMKQKLTHLALALLLLAALGCGTSEDTTDPVPIEIKTGEFQGSIELLEDATIQVRLLKAGELFAQIEFTKDGVSQTSVGDVQANIVASTDSGIGKFRVTEAELGDYTLQISTKGYQETELNVTVVADQEVSLDKVALVALAEPVSHLRGVLTDSETGEVLSDVLIQLTDKAGKEHEVLTTKDGVFTFENLPVDQGFTLTVMHKGFEDNKVDVDPISANQTFELDVELTAIPEPVKLDPGQGLSIGSQAPEFQLPDGNDKQHALADYVGSKNVAIVFYRGGW